MGFITDVVIQLALFLVFTINCENTTGIGHPLDPVLNVTTECITYRYVLCPKNMTAMTVIFEYEKMDDPYSSISKDSQCIFYRFIPCREASPDLILEQERHRQTKSINGKELKNFEEKKNLELSALENKLNCLTSQITQCEISQIISKENMKQLNVTENEKFVLQTGKLTLTDKVNKSETSRQRSDEHLILCKKLAYDLTLKSAACGKEIEGMKAAEKITEAQDEKKQLIDDKTKLNYSSIAKTFSHTPFSGKLGVQSYTLYQMGRMKIIPKLHIVPLVPQYGIVFNDVASISYNLEIPECKQSAESLADSSRSVFIAVVSAPENLQKRENIRATWKNHVNLVNRNSKLGITIEFAFVLGPTDDKSTQNNIIKESTKNEDIIQISKMPAEFPSHMTMPGVLNWIYYHCPQTEFLFKVEDDMYVNVHKLAYFVRDFDKFGNNGTLAIYSQMVDGQQNQPEPKRSGENKVTLDDWPWNTYPNYFDGPAYLMHKSTIFPLLAAIQTTPVYSFVEDEEVYITGICGDKVGLNRRISGKSLPVMWPRASETVKNDCDVHKFLSWKNTETLSHDKSGAIYSAESAPNRQCDYVDKNFEFSPLA